MHRYFPHTPDDIRQMLERCGVNALSDLYADVPEELRLADGYRTGKPMSEQEVREYFKALDGMNSPLTCFAGAGFYDHYTPAVIPTMLSRSEFLTAYTPYQAEISQGTLQYIFEYQTMITELTGLAVSNASMYDGTTALAESMLMTVASARKRNRVLVSSTLNPIYREVIDTYAHYHGVTVDTIPATDEGVTDFSLLPDMLAGGDVAGVIVATPNFHGILEDLTGVADACHAAKALLVISSPASALGVIKSPGEWGADIAAGEAQSLGMPLSYGGPYLGYMCCTKALIRKLPGRIVGATTDADGNRCFVLTLQAREQHIRRDKATSNICSNQGLMALHAAIYLSVMGREGLAEVNRLSCDGAHYLAAQLEAAGVASLKYKGKPFLNEFEVDLTVDADTVIEYCAGRGVLAGVKTGSRSLLIAVTEKRSRKEIDELVDLFVSLSKTSES
ncbi:MAG: aminomethyl-transferring glycine dehydrogenase subunit GcvPA [Lachnoclostridium sp.]|nr:aminomethyl-transferring glycine dehydrogenase subunit GcvPA [Lachnoclostridium sp.]